MDPTQDLFEALMAIVDGRDDIAVERLEELRRYMIGSANITSRWGAFVASGPRIKPDVQKVFAMLKAGGYVK